MRRLGKVVGVLILFVAVGVPSAALQRVSSAGVACPDIVVQALTATDEVCQGASRNQACYGHIALSAQPQTDTANFKFDAEGDIEDVVNVKSLSLSAMDEDAGLWGVALMRLQANLSSASPKENVTLLLFGEVEIDNATQDVTLMDITVRTSDGSNAIVRDGPGGWSMAALPSGTTVTATGRLEDGSWVRVQLPDERTGWVSQVLIAEDIGELTVVDAGSVYYAPMQAFYFRSVADDAACPEAPNSGLLIQTPEGDAKVTFLINEVDIQLGSTLYFQAQPDGEMTVSVVEGGATVTTGGFTSMAIAGSELTVQLDEEGHATGAPSLPRSYDMEEMEVLPVDHLDRAVTVAEPLSEEELAALIASIIGTGDQAPVKPHGEGGGGGGGGGEGAVPDNPSQAGENADSRACEDNPGKANEHRPDNVPPCR
jgi:hypothetical protein